MDYEEYSCPSSHYWANDSLPRMGGMNGIEWNRRKEKRREGEGRGGKKRGREGKRRGGKENS